MNISPILTNSSYTSAESGKTDSIKANTNKKNLNSLGLKSNKLPTVATSGGSMMDAVFKIRTILAPKPRTLTTSSDKKGNTIVKTEDGYSISFSGKRQEWTIINPSSGRTKIWGDPHVEESDGDKWNFNKTSTFIFGRNKITVETTPAKDHPGETYSKTVTIYNGNECLSITGIDNNKLELATRSFNSSETNSHDKSIDDGVVYHLKSQDAKNIVWERKEAPLAN